MADPINLNKFRKAKAKADKAQQAQEKALLLRLCASITALII